MKLWTTIILLFLSCTSVVHVVEGRRGCHICATLQQISTKLAQLQQIDATLAQVDAKLNQVDTTLGKLLGSGEATNSGSGSSSGELTHLFL